jgi:Rps23 Pro-64 3,4-dihydroxylase Tpa1-like proline 4-hydroxylase
LRLYDCIEEGRSRRAAETFTAVTPAANRLVVFPSEEFHEAMPVRCPSKQFADSRFAVTTWLHRAARPDPSLAFGWGHFRCGVVAPQFERGPIAGGSRA